MNYEGQVNKDGIGIRSWVGQMLFGISRFSQLPLQAGSWQWDQPKARNAASKATTSCYEYRACLSSEEKIACRDFSHRLMMTSDYGLQSLWFTYEWLGSIDRQVYLSAFDKEDGRMVGTFRMLPDCPVRQFDNLYLEFLDFMAQGKRVVDVGAYIDAPSKDQPVIFEGLFASTVHYLFQKGIKGAYIQVRPDQVDMYCKLGFAPATDEFQPIGWNTAWRGMWMDIESMFENHADPDFRMFWREKTGSDLNHAFWMRVKQSVDQFQQGTVSPSYAKCS